MFDIDLHKMFAIDTPLLEIFVRGTVMYLGLFVLMRVLVKRSAGTLSLSDLLVVVLIADAAQNGMAADYKSITNGLVLCATILFWSQVLDWLSFHSKFIAKLLEPPALPLVENGQMQRHNMRRELITEEELLSQLRQQGVDDLALVRKACIESDGHISVIRARSGGEEQQGSKHHNVF